jgi:hypothetical protein
MAQSFDIERFSLAHVGVIPPFREFGRRPARSAEEKVFEIRIDADERAIMMSNIAPLQLRSSLNRFLIFSHDDLPCGLRKAMVFISPPSFRRNNGFYRGGDWRVAFHHADGQA